MSASPSSTEERAAASRPEPADLSAALNQIRSAARGKPAPPFEARLDALERLERALLRRKDALCDAVSRDFGSRSRHETMSAEIFIAVEAIGYVRRHLEEWMSPSERHVGWPFVPAHCEVIPQPLGVVGIIAPWNYPIQLAIVPLIYALAAGNRAMLKPSELVPETAEALRHLLAEAFEEDEVFVVTGGAEVGEAFARLPFDHLVFTGSTRVGKLVMRAAAENLVPVTLELGGKSPAIVGEDASVDTAAARIMGGKLFNGGQTCIAPDYALVPKGKIERFEAACRKAASKLYPTLEANPDYTSIVNDRHYARLVAALDDARAKGAKVVEINPAGEALPASARKLAPALVLEPTEDMAVMQEEIFGPILPIVPYATLDEAIRYVDDHPRPLALYYFGHARAAIDRVLSLTISGGVCINDTMLHVAQDDLPFGGVGASGMGQYHGPEGFDAFTKRKPVFHQSRLNAASLARPPYGRALDLMLRFTLGR